VIDIDLPTALVSLNDLCVHDIAPTLTGLTGGGGLHLVYLCTDASLGNSASRLPGMDGELPGVDLRANGGYVVGPPSVHRSGGFYEWLDANANVDRPLPELSEEPRALVAGGETDAADCTGTSKALSRPRSNMRRAPLQCICRCALLGRSIEWGVRSGRSERLSVPTGRSPLWARSIKSGIVCGDNSTAPFRAFAEMLPLLLACN